MTTTTTVPPKTIPTFPAKAVYAALRAELIASVQAEALRKGKALPSDLDLVVAATIEIDSLIVVEILCVLDGTLPFQVGESVVRAGGYSSIKSALEHVMGQIEKEFTDHFRGGR
jgi:hypothetical protein